jgi:tRNA 2-thiouridine synthesizing protein D
MTFTIAIADPPYGKERPYTALRFALAAQFEGHEVRVFLLEDAVYCGKAGQKPADIQGLVDGRMPDCGELLSSVIKGGAAVKACGVCCKERGLRSEDLLAGVEIGSMRDLVQWVAGSDRTNWF